MDFFYNNKEILLNILTITTGLVSLIVIFVKNKKDKTKISLLEAINELLPSLINEAETLNSLTTGKEKKEYVLNKIKEITQSSYAVKLASDKIEQYLSTPQKKEN